MTKPATKHEEAKKNNVSKGTAERNETRKAMKDDPDTVRARKEDEVVEVGEGGSEPRSLKDMAPGTRFAPRSNPGAAAVVPLKPLQPESLQSHGEGIIFDKDTDNPPYDSEDPLRVDSAPSGSGSETNIGEGKDVKKEKDEE